MDYKKDLMNLNCKEEDRISLFQQMENCSQFNGITQPSVNPVYSMEFCPIYQAPNILAVSDEVGAVSLIDTHQRTSTKNKVLACMIP